MSLIHHRWLAEQLPTWEQEGIVTADGARRLRERYVAEPRGGLAQMIVGAVGALLIGTGLIALLASNWDEFPRWVRIAIALGPLAVTQAVSWWVLGKAEAAKPWEREAAAVMQTLAVVAAFAILAFRQGRFAVFAVAAVAPWLLPLAGIWQHERVIARGTVVRIECAAPDPYDPLRGRYLAVRPAESRVPKPEGMPEGMAKRDAVPVWATLVAGEDGLSRVESLSLEPVFGPTVIRLVAKSPHWDGSQAPGTVFLEWPFDRFYLNERLAPDADKLVAERFRAGKKTVAEIRLLDGRAVLTDILLDGVSIRDIVKQQAK